MKNNLKIKLILLMTVGLLFGQNAIGQTPLPKKQTLFQKIDSIYAERTATQLLEFQETKKGEWLKYLPTIGITYTIEGQPRPAISYSSNILYRATKDKQLRTAKRQQIIQQNQQKAEKAKGQLEKLLLEYEQLQEEIAIKKEILEIDRQLFEIEKAKYERLEIAPSDFLKAKQKYLGQVDSLQKLNNQIKLKAIKILQLDRI